jgi:hypothetical protein
VRTEESREPVFGVLRDHRDHRPRRLPST